MPAGSDTDASVLRVDSRLYFSARQAIECFLPRGLRRVVCDKIGLCCEIPLRNGSASTIFSLHDKIVCAPKPRGPEKHDDIGVLAGGLIWPPLDEASLARALQLKRTQRQWFEHTFRPGAASLLLVAAFAGDHVFTLALLKEDGCGGWDFVIFDPSGVPSNAADVAASLAARLASATPIVWAAPELNGLPTPGAREKLLARFATGTYSNARTLPCARAMRSLLGLGGGICYTGPCADMTLLLAVAGRAAAERSSRRQDGNTATTGREMINDFVAAGSESARLSEREVPVLAAILPISGFHVASRSYAGPVALATTLRDVLLAPKGCNLHEAAAPADEEDMRRFERFREDVFWLQREARARETRV